MGPERRRGVAIAAAVVAISSGAAAACEAFSGAEVPATAPPRDSGVWEDGAVQADAPSPRSCAGPDVVPCDASVCPSDTCLAPAHVPKGFGEWASAANLEVIDTTGDVVLDTSTGAAGAWRDANTDPSTFEVRSGIGFVRIEQAQVGPDLAIWVFSSLKIDASKITAKGDAAIVLASPGDITITSSVVFDLGAKGATPGPGGLSGGRYQMPGAGCGAGGSGGTNSVHGGGGGGFGTDGKPGGAPTGSAGGDGGLADACASFAELAVFAGGSGGGGADDSDSLLTIPFGGGGGGALQLTALSVLRLDGIVNVGGGGGRTPAGNSRNGAGGGSGGAVFLESPRISLGASAGIFANGGGGGSSSPGFGTPCTSSTLSEDGNASMSPALGGTCGIAPGGSGAAFETPATAGEGTPSSGSGGGGGGLGRIVLRTLPGVEPKLATPRFSPPSNSPAFRVIQTLGK